jgi:hypothetical protein
LFNAFKNLIGRFCPHEGFRIAVVDGQVISDGTFQLNGSAVSTEADLALGQRCEPALDLIFC